MAERSRRRTPALDAWLRREGLFLRRQKLPPNRQTFDRLWRTACWEAAAIECRAKGWTDAERYAWDMAKRCVAGHDWWDKGCPCGRCEREREEERKRAEQYRMAVTA